MRRYPDYQTYRELYARYFDGRGPEELLDLLEPLKDMRVADFCGGEGKATVAALARGASHVTIIDATLAMISPQSRGGRVSVRIVPIEKILPHMHDGIFDRIVCRQAVNYWLNAETAKETARALAPGGIFAFNTFSEKPPEKQRKLEYMRGGHLFVEVSWLVGDTVHHVQTRSGMAPHCTSFKWLSPEDFRSMLQPFFDVSVQKRGRTSLYRCVKK